MKRILFTGDTLADSRRAELSKQGFEVIPARIDMNEDELIAALAGMDAYILGGEEIATERVLMASKDYLKVATFFGTGYEKYIAVPKALELGIAVTNTPHANAHSVAEFTVALLLSTVKQVVSMNADTKAGQWKKAYTWDFSGKTVGIVGMGHVGEKVARILKNGFNMDVVYYSKTRKPLIEDALGARFVSLEELCHASDVISLHAQYSEDTIGMLGEQQFAVMKKNAVLINTARAELVDYKALSVALAEDRIAMAAYDCYYEEPVPKTAEDKYDLLALPDSKFVITPHAAYNTADAIQSMEDIAIDNTIKVLSGEACANIIRK